MTSSGQLAAAGLSPVVDGAEGEGDKPQISADSAREAVSEARNVGHEATDQARKLTSQLKFEVEHQVMQSRDKLSMTLRSLGDEMDQMAASTSSDSMSAQAVQKLAEAARSSAAFLEQRDLGGLTSELRQFASARPMLFLGGAVVAGGLLGRLTRSTLDSKAVGDGTAGQVPPDGRTVGDDGTSYDPTPRNADTPIAASTSEALGLNIGVNSPGDANVTRTEETL